MRVVVTVEGGLVTGVIVDNTGIAAVAVLDYDVEGDEAPDISPHGDPCGIAVFDGEARTVDTDYVRKVFGESEPKVALRIRFGKPSIGVPVDEYEFDTQGERDAFLQGVDAAQGWEDYEVMGRDGAEQE